MENLEVRFLRFWKALLEQWSMELGEARRFYTYFTTCHELRLGLTDCCRLLISNQTHKTFFKWKALHFPTAMSCVENIYWMPIGVENQIRAFPFYALFPHKILSYSCGVTQWQHFCIECSEDLDKGSKVLRISGSVLIRCCFKSA